MSETQAPAAAPEAAPAPAPAPAPVQSTAPVTQAPAPAPTQDRPSWLPEKFTSPEALAKAYASLEAKLSGGGAPKEAPTPAPAPTEAAPPAAPKVTPEEAAKAAEQAGLPDPAKLADADTQFLLSSRGLDVGAISEEYLSAGGLSADTYTKLEKAGLPRAFVDGWIEGREAQAEQHRQRLYGEVGGEAVFTQVQEWARANLRPAEIKAYNDAVSRGDVEMMALAVRGLHAKHLAAVGSRPTLIGGDASPAAAEGFGSQAELTAAMRDPRYRKDATYRAEVERKLSARPVMNVRVTK